MEEVAHLGAITAEGDQEQPKQPEVDQWLKKCRHIRSTLFTGCTIFQIHLMEWDANYMCTQFMPIADGENVVSIEKTGRKYIKMLKSTTSGWKDCERLTFFVLFYTFQIF